MNIVNIMNIEHSSLILTPHVIIWKLVGGPKENLLQTGTVEAIQNVALFISSELPCLSSCWKKDFAFSVKAYLKKCRAERSLG